MTPRVFITGIGLATPVGHGARECWSNLLAGRSGIRLLTRFDTRSFPVRIGGEVRGEASREWLGLFPEAGAERDRKIELGLDAASQAIGDADLPEGALATATLHVGVSLETFLLEEAVSAAPSSDLAGMLSLHFAQHPGACQLQIPLDRLASLLGAHYGFSGGRWTNCSACAAGAQAIGEAFRLLRDRRADVALAGAADSILHPLGLGGFSLLRILSTENDRPDHACRPFDATRQGTVLAEGAAFLVL